MTVKQEVRYYGAECWSVKKQDKRKLRTIEMRMVRMICGITLRDGLSNERIRDMTGVAKSSLESRYCDGLGK